MHPRFAVLRQKRHHLALAAGGLSHQLQRLLHRHRQLCKHIHLVPHLAARLRLAAERPRLFHALQQQRRIIAKCLLQSFRFHRPIQ